MLVRLPGKAPDAAVAKAKADREWVPEKVKLVANLNNIIRSL